MSLGRHLSGLRARFDQQALRPPAPSSSAADGAQAQQQPAWSGLLAWCQQGAGPGNSGCLQPGAKPAVAQRLAVAALHGPDDTTTRAWADAFARRLDGSVALAALPGGARGPGALAMRLRVKAHDAMWWRPRRPDDPWDAGWALGTPSGCGHWRSGFMPRRATLILAASREAATLSPHLAALAARSDDLWHPLRWVWVGGPPDVAPGSGLAVARFGLI